MVRTRFVTHLTLAALAAIVAGCADLPASPSAGASASSTPGSSADLSRVCASFSRPNPPYGSLSSVEVTSVKVVERLDITSVWWYAPLVHLNAPTSNGFTVGCLWVSIPGLLPPGFNRSRRVSPGESVDLFPLQKFYGEYAFEVGPRSLPVAPGSRATVIMQVRDDSGASATIAAEGPIVPDDSQP